MQPGTGHDPARGPSCWFVPVPQLIPNGMSTAATVTDVPPPTGTRCATESWAQYRIDWPAYLFKESSPFLVETLYGS